MAPPIWWVMAAVACAASAAYLLKRRALAPRALVLGAVFLTARSDNPGVQFWDSRPVWLGDGNEVFVTAHVVAEGNVQSDGPAELHQRIDIGTEKIETAAQTSGAQIREVHAGVRLNIYSRIESSDSPRLRHLAPSNSFAMASA